MMKMLVKSNYALLRITFDSENSIKFFLFLNFRKENLIEYSPDTISPLQWKTGKTLSLNRRKFGKDSKLFSIVCSDWIANVVESLGENEKKH